MSFNDPCLASLVSYDSKILIRNMKGKNYVKIQDL